MIINKYLISILAISAMVLSACSGSSSKKKTDDVANVECPDASFVTDGATGSCILAGTVNEDFTLTADTKWLLSGYVLVGGGNASITSSVTQTAVKAAGVTLTIEPGTDIRALSGGSLVVTRGSKIMAEGTAVNPITFSSAQDDDYDGEAEWGGVVVQGFAPQYGAAGVCGDQSTTWCNVAGEGGVGFYGGADEDDDSGIIRYVRIAEGGLVVGAGNEINGLTLQGVGHGTTVEYVQVHNNRDDGVELFGGTVNIKNLVLTANDDDDIDFDEGYKGNIQYALVIKNQTKTAPSGTNDPRGIEANSSGSASVEETDAVLANITIIGSPVATFAAAEAAMRLRGDVKVKIHNSAVKTYFQCYKIDTGANGAVAGPTITTVVLENFLGDCTADAISVADPDHLTTSGDHDLTLTLAYDAAYAFTNPEADGVTATITPINNGSGFVFDNTTYVGAVEPGTLAADAWWAGWTIADSL